MAVDEVLLAAASDEGRATLRLYQWSEPTLSLGYFQRYQDRQLHAASLECAMVRRASGGGAILHDRELTYSLVLPTRHPLARDGKGLTVRVHRALAELLATLFSLKSSVWTLRPFEGGWERPADGEPFLCFERRSPGDLLLVHSSDVPGESDKDAGWKILGSAQRRRRGAVLQHGSVLLARSPAAPELPGLQDLTGMTVTMEQLLSAVPTTLGRDLEVDIRESQLPAGLLSEAQRLARSKYGSLAWTERR